MTPGVTAIQLFTCQGQRTAGVGFYLMFGKELSPYIPLTAKQTDVQAALEALYTLKGFNLQFLSNPALVNPDVCADGNIVSIEFTEQFDECAS